MGLVMVVSAIIMRDMYAAGQPGGPLHDRRRGRRPRPRRDPRADQRPAGGPPAGAALHRHAGHVRRGKRPHAEPVPGLPHLLPAPPGGEAREQLRRVPPPRQGLHLLPQAAGHEPRGPAQPHRHRARDGAHHGDRPRRLRLHPGAHEVRPAHLRHRREHGCRHPGGHQRAAPPGEDLRPVLHVRRRGRGAVRLPGRHRALHHHVAPPTSFSPSRGSSSAGRA